MKNLVDGYVNLVLVFLSYNRENNALQINSDSSPYEPDDDFFSRPSRDDSALSSAVPSRLAEINGRPRGQSESVLPMTGARPNSNTSVCAAGGSTDLKKID